MIEAFITSVQMLFSGVNGWVTTTLHGNTIIAGAVTASIAGSLFYGLRKVPKQLWELLRKQILFTHVIEYNPYKENPLADVAMMFEQEIQKHISSKRSIARLGIRNKRVVETLADGGFLHWWDGFFVKIHRAVKPKQSDDERVGGEVVLSFTTMAIHRKQVIGRLKEMASRYTDNSVYQVVSSYTLVHEALRVAPLKLPPVLAIDHEAKKRIDNAIDNFVKNRSENNRLGLKHKLVFLLYGEPGTGKSAISEYVACKLSASLFCINANSTPSGGVASIGKAVQTARGNISVGDIPVLLCDDIDTVWRITRRKTEAELEKEKQAVHSNLATNADLGGLLADLQSPTEVQDCVVILTTNHLEKLDPALYRPGRVTELIEIKRMAPVCVKEYFAMRYNQQWPEHTLIERSLRGCDVSGYYESNHGNPQGFINAVLTSETSDEAFRAESDKEEVAV